MSKNENMVKDIILDSLKTIGHKKGSESVAYEDDNGSYTIAQMIKEVEAETLLGNSFIKSIAEDYLKEKGLLDSTARANAVAKEKLTAFIETLTEEEQQDLKQIAIFLIGIEDAENKSLQQIVEEDIVEYDFAYDTFIQLKEKYGLAAARTFFTAE